MKLVITLLAATIGLLMGLWNSGWRPSQESFQALVASPESIPIDAWLTAAAFAVLALLLRALGGVLGGRAAKVRRNFQDSSRLASETDQTRTSAQYAETRVDALREQNPHLCRILHLVSFGLLKFFTVPQGWVWTVVAFGRYRRLAEPGLRYCITVWGLYEKMGAAVPTKEQVDDYAREGVFTSDGVKCEIDMMLCYRVTNPESAIYQVEDYRQAMRQLVKSVLRNECGKRSTRNLLSGREEMAENLRVSVATDVEPWGIHVRLVEITNINLSDRA